MNVSLKWTGERLVPTVLNEIAVEHLARYAFCKPFIGGKKVLDVACGEGYGSSLLAKTAAEVIGVDIDEKTINHATNKYSTSNLTFINASVLKLPFEDHSFDVVVSFETIEHLKEQSQMLAEIKRILKPDGVMIVSTPNVNNASKERRSDNVFHEKELTKTEFNDLLKRHFRHTGQFNQQNIYGSLIYPQDLVLAKLEEAKGTYQELTEGSKLKDPCYFIAIASDGELPLMNSVFFDAANIYEERFAALKNTVTYRAGEIILFPIKWLKSIFYK